MPIDPELTKILAALAASGPLKKLIEELSKGIGSVGKPVLDILTAKTDGIAARIREKNAHDIRRLQLLHAEELSAPPKQLPPGNDPSSENEIEVVVDDEELRADAKRAVQNVVVREMKERANVLAIAGEAAENLGAAASDGPVDPDWATRFFDSAKKVSDVEAQKRWGKILAGEVSQPGRFSLRTLDVLRNLQQVDALLLARVAPFGFEGGDIVNENDVFIRVSQLTYNDLLRLEEAGLLQRGMNFFAASSSKDKFVCGFGFLDKWVTLTGTNAAATWNVPSIRLTSTGNQLRSLSQYRADARFLEELRKLAAPRGFTLEVSNR